MNHFKETVDEKIDIEALVLKADKLVQACGEYKDRMIGLNADPDAELLQEAQTAINQTKAFEIEGILCMAFDDVSVTNKRVLYDGCLEQDRKLQALTHLNPKELLHPTLSKKLDMVLQ